LISVHDAGCVGVSGDLSGFRQEWYRCLPVRGDALFELCDAVLCAEGPVSTLVGLSLTAEHRRGHGGLYDGLAAGRIDVASVRRTLTGLPVPRDRDGRIVLAVDVSPWLRPDAATSDDRCFCHTYGRGKGQAQLIPGWPYSFVAALEPGASSWCALLDLARLGRDDDATVVTAAQVRDVVAGLAAAGQHRPGDPDILIVFDASYDICRLTWLLADLPVQLLGRVRSDRVFCFPPEQRARTSRPRRHGAVFDLADAGTHPVPEITTSTDTTRYGVAVASSWTRLHPRLVHQGRWADHPGELPIISGSVIRLSVDRLPGDRNPKPVWLWASQVGLTAGQIDRCWQAFLRRFDVEHTFRFLKQTLGWTRPRIRTAAAGDRWTWLIVAAYTQLRLARGHTSDLRRPWEKRSPTPLRSPRPGSVAGFATSAGKPAVRPDRRNPPGRVQAVHSESKTATSHPTQLSVKPVWPRLCRGHTVKSQAKSASENLGAGRSVALEI
jgi:hypothetical protein